MRGGGKELNPRQRQRILFSAKELLQRRLKAPVARLGVSEEGHGGAEFQIVRRAEYLTRGAAPDSIDKPRTFYQPGAEHRVTAIRPGLFQRGKSEALRHRAPAQPGDLRKDEPHPMPAFPAPLQFDARLLVNRSLRSYEYFQIAGNWHGIRFMSAPASWMRKFLCLVCLILSARKPH